MRLAGILGLVSLSIELIFFGYLQFFQRLYISEKTKFYYQIKEFIQNWGSQVADPVIKTIGRSEFEDGFRPGSPGEVFWDDSAFALTFR